jgi:hypothetical protein
MQMDAQKAGMDADTTEDQKLPPPGERFILLLTKPLRTRRMASGAAVISK